MVNDSALFSGTGPFISYKQALKAGEFKIQKCESCGKHIYYPRSLCNHCGSPRLAWVKASGKGIVYSTSIVRQKPEQGPDYNIALVDLEEGPRMLTRIVDIKPEDIRIGMPVQGAVGDVDGEPAVVFRASTGGRL
ncbi:MAG: Zn-ribbon domain-containing OB-fold protein [Gammaproteobacteria bacterium]|nr:MAG: Zn-ribbon domain-containing OB-fold protein [Gammaproteobacteria bacterium]